ncbi:hypothetical protein [Halocatena pleomorpha]|uniref:Uncharacterized protein n=1 Tax=Halocatena pleomorpha TaxID=1785090 RepID=A0A3P3RJS5_9EURY|nr:hypothetical protein [Halocatena pleomorpha]RRJ33796.1 hypothetical protein EIK79_03160 [Halocatena pleomorpha]
MARYEPECADETLFLSTDTERIEIGTIDDIVAAIGGETYTIEYDEKQRTQAWLDTDEGRLEIDVRETVTTLPHTEETVSKLREYDMETDRYGLPTRTVEFTNEFVDILEQQGTTTT